MQPRATLSVVSGLKGVVVEGLAVWAGWVMERRGSWQRIRHIAAPVYTVHACLCTMYTLAYPVCVQRTHRLALTVYTVHMSLTERTACHCDTCGHEWLPVSVESLPTTCPARACRSRRWNSVQPKLAVTPEPAVTPAAQATTRPPTAKPRARRQPAPTTVPPSSQGTAAGAYCRHGLNPAMCHSCRPC